MKSIITIIFSIFWFGAYAQTGTIVPARVVDVDTIPEITLSSYQVVSKRTRKSRKKLHKFLRLQKKVVKVYPLAHLASQSLEAYAVALDTVKTDREKKKFYKQIEQEIKEEYEGQLRQLTVSEGRILIKLLDRETGSSSYSLVSELRGNFSAFFWQGLARVFGHNLKDKYDPKGVDKDIEFIVIRIESGVIKL